MTLLAEAEALAGRSGSPALRGLRPRPARAAAAARRPGRRGDRGPRRGRRGDRRTPTPYDQMVDPAEPGTCSTSTRVARPVARADFEHCVEVAARSGDREHEEKARHNLGYVEFLAGRIPRALAAMEEAAALGRGDPHPISLLDRARVLREAGLAREAAALLTRAADALRGAPAGAGRGRGRAGRTPSARSSRTTSARRSALARRAERAFGRRGNTLWQRKAQMLVLRCERRTVGGGRARAPVPRWSARGPASWPRTAARSSAATWRGRRRCSPSSARCGRAVRPDDGTPSLPAMRAADPLQARLQAREVRALAALHRGDRARAARGGAAAGSTSWAPANRFGSLDLRTASAVHGCRWPGSASTWPSAPAARRALRGDRARPGDLHPAGPGRAAHRRAHRRPAQRAAPLRGGGSRPARATRRVGEELARLRGAGAGCSATSAPAPGSSRAATASPGRRSARVGEVREAAQAAGTAFVSYVVHRGRWRAVVASARPAAGGRPGRRRARSTSSCSGSARTSTRWRCPCCRPRCVDAVRRSLDAGLARLDALLRRSRSASTGPPLRGLCSGVAGAAAVEPAALAAGPAGRRDARARPRGCGPAPPERRTSPRVVSVAGPGLHRAEEEAAPGARAVARRPAAHR